MAEMYHLLNDKDFFNDFRESLKTLWVTGDYSDITLVSDDLIPFGKLGQNCRNTGHAKLGH